MRTALLPHVLVVGENAGITSAMCQSLASSPFRCTGVVGPREAVAATKRTGVDVALLDVSGLRPEDGLSLAKRLREETQDLGVVLVATTRSLEDLVEALRVGVVDYLSKPLTNGELVDAVRRAVEWRSAVLLSRGSLARYEQEMALGARKFAAVFAGAGITSSVELQTCLEQLYGKNVAGFEHVRRVASAAVLIANNLQVAEPVAGHIERAALLHDIGKLLIPKPILRKSWPLSAGEHALIRSHLRVAADAMAGLPYLAPAAEIVLATRERYDGKGYPLGLRGTAIALGGRIIAIAEAFDTLRAGPDSSESMSTPAANAELVRAAGSLFDPSIINAWLQSLDRFERNAHEGLTS